jgi:DNA-directed RNA polymerase subunit H (RpoH/RPB5)
MENTSLQDILIRSRITILDLLDARGYNTKPYKKMIGGELVKLIESPEALRMEVQSKSDPSKKAIVNYNFGNIKQSVGTGDFVKRIVGDGADRPAADLHNVDPATTEVLIIFMTKKDDSSDDMASFNKGALEAWTKHNLKIQFFPIVRLVNNPLKHVLQPKFEIVPKEQHAALMKEWFAESKSQFPIIRFHDDMVSRCLGLVPLDIVKITEASPTAGEYVKYRVCAP